MPPRKNTPTDGAAAGEGTQDDPQAPAAGTSPDAGAAPAGDDAGDLAAQAAAGTPGSDGTDGTQDGGGVPPVNQAPAAAPLAPPAPPAPQSAQPGAGTDPNAARRDAPQNSHEGIVDINGNPIRHDDLFDDEGPHLTWMRARRRIFQLFRLPGSHDTTGMHLLFPEGTQVPRHDAHRVMTLARQNTQDGKTPQDTGTPPS